MPGGEHLRCLGMVNAGRVFRQVTFFRKRIQSRKQGQPFVSHQRHDVAVTFDGPKLQRQTSAQGVPGGDHFGAGQARGLGQLIQLQADQIRNE